MTHKAGFVNIIGNPNVGKSTLMNVMVGEKLSVITSKVQTTRHRIMGIVNGEGFQIIYSDTPGILDPHHLLHRSMMKSIETAIEDADIFLLVTDVNENFDKTEILDKIKKTETPVIVIINKIDLSDQHKVNELIKSWSKKIDNAEIIPASAIKGFNVEKVFNSILDRLPEAPAYFSKDELTDKAERFFISEIIREKILLYYQQEIPYCSEVVVESFKEDEKIIRIQAVIYVDRETQKAILIGNKGKAIKKTGIESRKDIENFFQKHVYLELFVKVSKDWRNNENQLRRFGYIN